MGTLLTFAGALIKTLYKGPIINFIWSHKLRKPFCTKQRPLGQALAHSWDLLYSCSCWLFCVIAWASFFILQSITVKTYPAEISLAFWICLMGAVQSAALALVAEHHTGIWAIGWNSRLLAPVYTYYWSHHIIAIGLYTVVWGIRKGQFTPAPLTKAKIAGAAELPVSTADIAKPDEEGTNIDKLVDTLDDPMNIPKE